MRFVRPVLATIVILPAFLAATAVFAAADTPACLDNGQAIDANDAEVLQWESTTQTNYLARAHITGPISQVLPNATGHSHFNVKIGPSASDVVEVIYDTQFGALPHLTTGMTVEACGDYITVVPHSSGTTGYAHGILHWIHAATGGTSHEPGYITINGTLYGQQ